MNKNYQQTITNRQEEEKKKTLEYLEKMPIVQIACERASISRATYYRWRNDDKEFKKLADRAIREGELFINDLSESQVITLIKDKSWSAISFWLRHHHPKYADKIKVEANINRINDVLSPEQEKIIRKALAFISQHKKPLTSEKYGNHTAKSY